MIRYIDKFEYLNNKLKIKNLIKELFNNDNDKIANLEEIINHLDFIFSQENNKAFLLLNIENDKLICMVNFLEYNNISKDWCLFSVFTKKEERNKGLAKEIIQYGINKIKELDGKTILAGIEPNNKKSIKLHESLNFKYSGMNWDEISEGFPENHLAYIYKI